MQEMLYCRRPVEKYEFEYRQNFQNICNFWPFRPIMQFQLVMQKSKKFNWKTKLQKKN